MTEQHRDRLDALGVEVIKEARAKLIWVCDIIDKVDAIIEKYAPDFGNWLPGGDSMDGMCPLDRSKYIYEKTYMTPDYKQVVVRIDKEGFLTFEKEKERGR